MRRPIGAMSGMTVALLTLGVEMPEPSPPLAVREAPSAGRPSFGRPLPLWYTAVLSVVLVAVPVTGAWMRANLWP
jgi:hypothetical protein